MHDGTATDRTEADMPHEQTKGGGRGAEEGQEEEEAKLGNTMKN